jgi:hypothetical protein
VLEMSVFGMKTLKMSAALTSEINRVSAIAALLISSTAFAHEAQAQPMATLADCPPGYVLAVQDTALPQPLAALPPTPTLTDDTSPAALSTAATAEAAQEALAPRQFVTGCVPAQPQNK